MASPSLSLSASLPRWQQVLPFAIATLGELAALGQWLHQLRAHHVVAANLWLWAGFAVERGAVAWWLRRAHPRARGVNATPLPKLVVGLFVATVVEVLIWHGWLWSDGRWNLEIAGLLLFVAIHALHAAEMAGVRDRAVAEFLVRPKTLLFSLAEALGATAWLGLTQAGHPVWGLVALGVGLFVEHTVQGAELVSEGV